MQGLGDGGNETLHQLRFLLHGFGVGVNRAIDERQVELLEIVNEIEPVFFAARVQWRRHRRGVDNSCDHGVIALGLAAAHGPDRDIRV